MEQNQEQNTPIKEDEKKSVLPKLKKGIGARDILNFFLASIFVSLIVFGAFLCYIVFNPEQAKFFTSFGINPRDIATLLGRMVNVVFTILTLVFSVLWIIFLFRVFLTEKKYIRRRTLAGIGAVTFGLLLFGGITTWAYLMQKIGASDYENPNGGVLIYDNELLLSNTGKGWAQMSNFDNLIGPVTLRFDIASNAKYNGRNMDIKRFTIDFNNDGKADNTVDTNPTSAEGILYTFDKKGTFTPKITYIGVDKVTNESVQKEIDLPAINISEIISVGGSPRLGGGIQMTFDATSLKSFGNTEWYFEKNSGNPTASGYVANAWVGEVFSSEVKFKDYAFSYLFSQQELVCLRLTYEGRKEGGCDRIFVVRAEGSLWNDVEIATKQDPTDPLTVTFSYTGAKAPSVGSASWEIDDVPVSTEMEYTYKFSSYGKHTIVLALKGHGKDGQLQKITKKLDLREPLALVKQTNGKTSMQILDKSGVNIVDKTSGDIYTVSIPQTLTFDSKFVRAVDKNFDLEDISWDFDGAGTYAQKGKTLRYNFFQEKKYTIIARYTFKNLLSHTRQTVDDVFVFDGQKQDVAPELVVTQDSTYAPSRVRFDGSASSVRTGEIMEYRFDFGDGKGEVKGDAVQTYLYKKAGEYTVVFTAVKTDGTKRTIKKQIIVKNKSQQKVAITPSLAQGVAGQSVSFESDLSGDDIDTYTWDFGDGGTASTQNPSHTYAKAGKYTIKLDVLLKDGRIRDATIDFEVVASEE